MIAPLRAVVVLAGSLIAALSATPRCAAAGEWPQILGPDRNGIARNERIVDKLPAAGPTVVWKQAVGEGFAGVAVAKGRAILFHRQGNQEIVEALDAATGKRHWKREFPATYAGGVADDHGPRCVPLIHDDRVFLFGAAGNLHCVSFDKGEALWSRAVSKDYRVPDGYFGIGSTPIVEGDKLLVNVGGRAGAGIVAFALSDGRTVWQATNELASYSSPVAVTLDGTRHIIFVTRLAVVSLDPENGAVRWSFPFGDRGPTVNAATPLVIDGHLFVSASYGIGAVWSKIGKSSAQEVWASNDVMSSQYATCVLHAAHLFGSDGRADVGVARLRCFDPQTGKVRWTEEGFGAASLLLADGKLIILRDDGTLVLAKADPTKYEELGRARVLDPKTRALPALADGRLYVRDEQTLKCLDLRRP